MPVNGDTSASVDKLSGIEEEADMYEAFAPHVDTSQITVLTDSPPGKFQIYTSWFYIYGVYILLIFCCIV